MLNKSALILGGNGFIGKNLCKKLISENFNVTSFDINIPDKKINEVEYIAENFFNEKVISEIIKNKDIIYHCISTINPGNSTEKYVSAFENDFIYTVKMFQLLEKTKTSVIFLSSGGTVYGDTTSSPTLENDKTEPKQFYGCLKLCIEEFIKTYNRLFNTKHIIARISNPYGPGQDITKGVGFIDTALYKAICNQSIEIWGDGENIRDYIYISDVCNMLYALAKYNGDETVFNISSGEGYSQNEIINILKDIGLSPSAKYTKSRNFDVKSIVLDNTLIKEVYPITLINLHEGIKSFYKKQF